MLGMDGECKCTLLQTIDLRPFLVVRYRTRRRVRLRDFPYQMRRGRFYRSAWATAPNAPLRFHGELAWWANHENEG